MWLKKISITNCRNIQTANLNLCSSTNYIYGNNGSGKTSLLEALSILSMGRSFRTTKIKQVIHRENKSIMLTGLISSQDIDYPIGIKKGIDGTTIKINKQLISTQSELSRHLPLTVIHPLSYELITGGANLRRKYIDWIAFYLDANFHPTWVKYQKILKQRNAALRDTRFHYALDHLTSELCLLQPKIHQARVNAVELLQQKIVKITPDILSDYIPDIKLSSGFPANIPLDKESLFDYYHSQRTNELRLKRTLKGSHQADIIFTINGEFVSTNASRGQTKIIAILLWIAQNLTIKQSGILAFDDLHAELDAKHYNDILILIESIDRQIIITSIEKPVVDKRNFQGNMFHVKQGCIKPVF